MRTRIPRLARIQANQWCFNGGSTAALQARRDQSHPKAEVRPSSLSVSLSVRNTGKNECNHKVHTKIITWSDKPGPFIKKWIDGLNFTQWWCFSASLQRFRCNILSHSLAVNLYKMLISLKKNHVCLNGLRWIYSHSLWPFIQGYSRLKKTICLIGFTHSPSCESNRRSALRVTSSELDSSSLGLQMNVLSSCMSSVWRDPPSPETNEQKNCLITQLTLFIYLFWSNLIHRGPMQLADTAINS